MILNDVYGFCFISTMKLCCGVGCIFSLWLNLISPLTPPHSLGSGYICVKWCVFVRKKESDLGYTKSWHRNTHTGHKAVGLCDQRTIIRSNVLLKLTLLSTRGQGDSHLQRIKHTHTDTHTFSPSISEDLERTKTHTVLCTFKWV